ncbi:MAG: tRNA (adenosine(37)-N6)-dimethylallyltransferase MiaA [Planctomycetes bacterium]|nr:tRNA (adenosine(37)-N6)-dimethylallyltransferase MiaA [Planctomycetota bacterium]
MTQLESSPSSEPLLFLVGPTAVGKTAFALELAEKLGAEIVSLDSMQVYRRMDIGTAKPSATERARVPHACLDLVEPSERYDVSRYLVDAERALGAARKRGRRALFVGGTGLYLRALAQGLFGGPEIDPALRAELEARACAEGSPALHAELAPLDPAAAARIHPNDAKRVVRALEILRQSGRTLSEWQREWGWHGAPANARALRLVGLALEPEEHARRSVERVRAMFRAGWVDEARAIRDSCGFGPSAIQALGYREVLAVADGELSLAACEERVLQLTRRFVRRQRTWFRSFPAIRWLAPGNETARDEARAEFERDA